MAKKSESRIDLAAINEYFNTSAKTTYSAGSLVDIFRANRRAWNLPRSVGDDVLLQILVQRTNLTELVLRSENYPAIFRYTWGPPQPLSVALSIRPTGYFSHGTAMWIHSIGGTTNEIFVNREQSHKTSDPKTLSQDAIDLAFRNHQRHSKLIYTLETSMSITVLSGKNSKQLEVGNAKAPSGEIVKVTSLERTLVDITVRPAYAGGVPQIIEAFRLVRGKVSISRVLDILQKLDYSYPYHQPIGFYLKRSAYPDADLDLARNMGIKVNFYADYAIKDPAYDSEFRTYYPKSLDR